MDISERLLLISFRGAEVLIVVVIAGLCIYFGYRLFDRSLRSVGELKFEGHGFKIALSQFGPGIAFALFGATILSYSVKETALSLKAADGSGSLMADSPAPISTNKEQAFRSIKALNQAVDLLSQYRSPSNRENDMAQNAITGLNELRGTQIDVIYGEGTSDMYQKWLAKSASPEFLRSLPASEQQRFAQIKALLEEK